MELFQPWHIVLLLAVSLFFCVPVLIVPAWQVVRKAGFHPALSLLLLVPLVNVVMLYVFAFSRWPAEHESQNISRLYDGS